MKDIRTYTHLLYSISGVINKLKMKEIRMESGVKINSAAMSLLNVIDTYPGMSVTDLSRRMDLTKSAISQMLKKLCALGLLKKSRNGGNSKNVYPELTEKGRRTAVEYREKHDRFYACITGLLSGYAPDEQELICRFLTETDEAVRGFCSSVESGAEAQAGE